MRGRTTIVATHRLSAATTADVIMMLEAGTIVEVGGPQELFRGHGAFARLQAQSDRSAPPLPAAR
jgi:ATP-binding cassette subfamily B protein